MLLRIVLIFWVAGSFGFFQSTLFAPVAFARRADARGVPASEIALGERLFLDPRFSHEFWELAVREGRLATDSSSLQQQAIGTRRVGTSCASCHFVDQLDSEPGKGPRGYTDFEIRSAIPARGDGLTTTLRNSPTLIEVLAREGADGHSLTHFDGEFGKVEDLVSAGLTGRNFGWLPGERGLALVQLVRVLREDVGNPEVEDSLAAQPYRTWFQKVLGAPEDSEMALAEVSRLISLYLRSLTWIRDAEGSFAGSPYDEFLKRNDLPREPAPGESGREYLKRLQAGLGQLHEPKFVEGTETMKRHEQPFVFGPVEYAGMRVFFSTTSSGSLPSSHRPTGSGQCVQCHLPPHFSDFSFHSVGISQRDFDRHEGVGAFEKWINSPALRDPAPARIGRDFGVWHLLAGNRALSSRAAVEQLICASLQDEGQNPSGRCPPEELLSASMGRFKTPTLRNLGHSAPYFHDGSQETLRGALLHYMAFSEMARRGRAPGISKHLSGISLSGRDITSLESFLKALNEDYD